MATAKNYLSLIKFSHTIFALPFALIGFSLGIHDYLSTHKFIEGTQFYKLFFLVLVCMVTARSSAMAFNRWLDRKYDALNPRTAIREIPSGIILPRQALLFTIFSSVAFVTVSFFINRLCFYLSPIALFVILFYSYTKRFTALCHIVLGLGLSLAPIGAYLAVTSEFSYLPLLFSCTVICWVAGFDIIFALQDIEFDASQQLYSIPSIFGKEKGLAISRTLHGMAALFVIMAGLYGSFHPLYWIGTAGFCTMLIYQQSIVKPNDLSKVNIAFITANGVASVVFSIFVVGAIVITTYLPFKI